MLHTIHKNQQTWPERTIRATTRTGEECNWQAIERLQQQIIPGRDVLVLPFIFNKLHILNTRLRSIRAALKFQEYGTLRCKFLHNNSNFASYVLDSLCKALASALHLSQMDYKANSVGPFQLFRVALLPL